jgi:hypothetical protein
MANAVVLGFGTGPRPNACPALVTGELTALRLTQHRRITVRYLG